MTGSEDGSGVEEVCTAAALIDPEPDGAVGQLGFMDRNSDIWARQLDGWWPAIDQAGQGTARYPTAARPFMHPWSWEAMVAQFGPGKVFALPDPADTGSLPRLPPELLEGHG